MGRNASKNRCPRCEIHQPLCFCTLIPRIEVETRVMVLMHVFELKLTTNTARLAEKALANSSVVLRGEKDGAPLVLEKGRTPLLLYPSDEAVELTRELVSGPVTLIVPDGSWRQARKVAVREPALQGVKHVKLPPGPPSEYRLRESPDEQSVCTFEAIARALGVLEGAEVQSQLEWIFRVMVERTLWSRGTIKAEDCVTAGIPEAARFKGSGGLTFRPSSDFVQSSMIFASLGSSNQWWACR